jgi:hypothetical protein
MAESENERIERLNRKRQEDLERIPLQKIDKSKWPKKVRPIAIEETDGLGIDADGRLYWNGKPVEIIRQRLDLTGWQMAVAVLVMIFTGAAAIATGFQAWTGYREWNCKLHAVSADKCPAESPIKVWGE